METEDNTICIGKNGESYSLANMFKTVREILGNGNEVSETELKIFMRSEMFREVFPHWHEAFNSMERRVLEQLKAKTATKPPVVIKQEKLSVEVKQEKPPVVVKQEKPPVAVKQEKSETDDDDDEPRVKSSKHPAVAGSNTSAPKIHPFYLQETSAIIQPKGKLLNGNQSDRDDDDSDRDRDKHSKKKKLEESTHKKKKSHHHHHRHKDKEVSHHSKQPPPPPQPKGKSYYNPSSAKAIENGKIWKPHEDVEFSKNRKPFKLGGLSILCVDLANLDNIFYNPSKGHSSKSTASIPLRRNMIIPDRKAEEIERQETKKRRSFQPVLRKMYSKNVKNRHPSFNTNNTKKEYGKLSSKDQRQKGLEQLREKNETKTKSTRKLPWENKEFFDAKKPNRPSTAEKKESGNVKDKKTPVLGKIPKIHAPGTSMQAILQQISSANVDAASKPKIELKIPKFSETAYTFKRQPAQKSVQQGLVAVEVDKLLRSNTTVQCPAMSSSPSDLAEYTIRKIGWWFLKEEQDPPEDGLYHPELHDNEIYEDWYDPDDHRDDDDISIGCVSDPEGTEEPVLPAGKKPERPDADKLDEYAGLASLESRIPKVNPDMKPGKDLEWVRFIKPKQGTAYEKNNFEAKCYICDGEIVKGRRQLGAHFRSDHHKDAFRNYCKGVALKLAKYEERAVKVPVRKVFVAKLIQYTTDDYAAPVTIDISNDPPSKNSSPREEVETGNDEVLVPDSPRAVIDGNDESMPAAEKVRLQDVDEVLSLPSLALYDLEQDNQQLRAKICLRTNGLWTDEMEKRWLVMQEKETRMTEEYNETREKYINAPDSHPLKNNEWVKFWERRCSEVEEAGKNPDEMDFGGEWVPFWLKRVQEIMKADIEAKMLKMKQELGLDATTLTERCKRHGHSPDTVKITGNQQQSVISEDNVIQTLPAQSNPLQDLKYQQNNNQMTEKGYSHGQPIHVMGTSNYARPAGAQRHIQQTNKFPPLNINTSVRPPALGNTRHRWINPNKDQNNLKDARKDYDQHQEYLNRNLGRDRSRSRSPGGQGRNRFNRKDRKRNRRSPPRQLDNNRRPSNEEKHYKQIPPTPKLSASPESDWEKEPQPKLAKPSAYPGTTANNTAVNQYVKNYNSAAVPDNRRTSFDDKQRPRGFGNKISSPESDWEKEPQQKPSAFPIYSANNTSVNQYSKNYNSASVPEHRRTSFDNTHHRPRSSGNKISSPESDWETDRQEKPLTSSVNPPNITMASPANATAVGRFDQNQKYSGNYDSGPKYCLPDGNRRPSNDAKYPSREPIASDKASSPESNWETEAVRQISANKPAVSPNHLNVGLAQITPISVIPEGSDNKYHCLNSSISSTKQVPPAPPRKDLVATPTPTHEASQVPDLSSLLAELEEAKKLVDPIITPPELPTDAPLGDLSTLETILSDDDANDNDIPYSPVSVLSMAENDPIRGVSPINSIELSVEMTPVEEEIAGNDADPPTLEKVPKCEKSPKRRKSQNAVIINPSSPEDGEIDSPPSSIDRDQKNPSSFIAPFNEITAKQGESTFCAQLDNLDKNSLGYQLFVKNRDRKISTDSSSSSKNRNKHRSSSKKESNSHDRPRDKEARKDNHWL